MYIYAFKVKILTLKNQMYASHEESNSPVKVCSLKKYTLPNLKLFKNFSFSRLSPCH